MHAERLLTRRLETDRNRRIMVSDEKKTNSGKNLSLVMGTIWIKKVVNYRPLPITDYRQCQLFLPRDAL